MAQSMSEVPPTLRDGEPAPTVSAKRQPVPMWGRDHWQVLFLLELWEVMNSGRPDLDKLACNHGTHPQFRGPHALFKQTTVPSTTLFNGAVLAGYDDWDIIEDLVWAGMVRWDGTGMTPIFHLTDLGWHVAGQLRRFAVAPNNGRIQGNFRPDRQAKRKGRGINMQAWMGQARKEGDL